MEFIRLRRLRENPQIREWLSQTHLQLKDLILPYFIIEGRNKKETIKSLPGIFRLTIDNLLKDIEEAKNLGIKAVLLFGKSDKKDNQASEAYQDNGLVQKALREIRENIKEIVVITDVCLCGYTSHGHCGIILPQKRKNSLPCSPRSTRVEAGRQAGAKTQNWVVDNDETLKILAKIAVSHAQAGVDLVAPSAMMDGQVQAIREALDKNGFQKVGILAYSAKYASNFYGPFREALESAPKFGDRKTYQIDFRNSDEALREIEQDIKEGADIVMVKPALAYLDIISKAKQRFNVPLAAYNVSGEYALVKSAVKAGIVDEKNIILEILTSIKRAGADLIITYHAKEVARWLKH